MAIQIGRIPRPTARQAGVEAPGWHDRAYRTLVLFHPEGPIQRAVNKAKRLIGTADAPAPKEPKSKK